ncbi:Bifunctional demethylmenaquinone methyltransferase/2-methoxy-6-polyprenyl-1,4-benzoquinol methylase UbiE [Candidatus Hepatincolaceae symbiont of Richtersius coronifer]
MTDNKDFFTNFGFKKVNLQDKVEMVKGVFDGVASKYDLMNDLMSLGLHRIWKQRFINLINPQKDKTLIDIGGGTADIALNFVKLGGNQAYVLDINYKMLQIGREKALNSGYEQKLYFIQGDAEALPFKDNSVNICSTAFCIRNVTNINKALEEMYRVLKPGGSFFCLEFSKVNNQSLANLYDMWSFHAIPRIGKLVAKNEEAYQYLVESIRMFPSQEEFAQMIRNVGFKQVAYDNINFGVACIHYGRKIV